jgi:hypothetical protein
VYVSHVDSKKETVIMSETIDPEIAAIQVIATALASLDSEATLRVLAWANKRFGLSAGSSSTNRGVTSENIQENGFGSAGFNDLAELYNAASPSTDAEKALVTGYWFQFHDGVADFGAQTINTALKHLGQGVSNITTAFETLKAQRPALVMQMRKMGPHKQARKKYKLTDAGKKAVEQMVGQQ